MCYTEKEIIMTGTRTIINLLNMLRKNKEHHRMDKKLNSFKMSIGCN